MYSDWQLTFNQKFILTNHDKTNSGMHMRSRFHFKGVVLVTLLSEFLSWKTSYGFSKYKVVSKVRKKQLHSLIYEELRVLLKYIYRNKYSRLLYHKVNLI